MATQNPGSSVGVIASLRRVGDDGGKQRVMAAMVHGGVPRKCNPRSVDTE